MNLGELKAEYSKLIEELQNPELISDYARFQELSRRRTTVEKILTKADEVETIKSQLAESREMLGAEDSPELLSLAVEEVKSLQEKLRQAEQELQGLLSKGSHEYPGALILEFRPGTGGEEAALFASDLLSMYERYATSKGWRIALLQEDRTEIGGVKNAALEIEGEDAFEKLQYEGGVHRVQRIPETEKAGRIHTSTASVAILPRAKKAQFQINPADLKIDFTTSSGPGGQNVNKRETAVRLTHVPTGLVIFSHSFRTQQKNKEAALSLLESKLLAQKQETEAKELAGKRNAQIGWAKRVEKIRTYNFPQDRITDHRIEKSFHGLEKVLAGDLDPVAEALLEYQKSKSS